MRGKSGEIIANEGSTNDDVPTDVLLIALAGEVTSAGHFVDSLALLIARR